MSKPGPARRSPGERFWAKVEKSDGCWMWAGYRDRDGYGKFVLVTPESCEWMAHRASWTLANGPIPKGMTVDHLCFQPGCVRPDHLRLLTHSENSRNQRRATKTHCIHGHEYTPENTMRRADNGTRFCRTCHYIAKTKAYHAKKEVHP